MMRKGMSAWQIVGAYLILAAALLIGNTVPNDPKSPRYHVANDIAGVSRYLAWADTSSSMTPRIKVLWVVDESQAWDFANYASAQQAIDQFGGWAVAVGRKE